MIIDEKLDKILRNQEIIIQMLTDIMEMRKSVPNIATAFKPILENPLIASNPSVRAMLDNIMDQMGGS